MNKVYRQIKIHLAMSQCFFQIPCGVTYPISGTNSSDHPQYGVSYSASYLTHSVQPSDCNSFKFCNGGVAMKLMDNVAGITAFRHARCNVVTISIGEIESCVSFLTPLCKNTTLLLYSTSSSCDPLVSDQLQYRSPLQTGFPLVFN